MYFTHMTSLELKIPPPVQALLTLIGMWLVARYSPSFSFVLPWRTGLAILLASAGILCILTGVLAFRKAMTTVNPLNPDATAAMVTSGIYRLSRNPMYLGLLLALTGCAIYLANALAFLFLPVFVACISRLQIVPEERALAAKFGDAFAAYKRSVRRWL